MKNITPEKYKKYFSTNNLDGYIVLRIYDIPSEKILMASVIPEDGTIMDGSLYLVDKTTKQGNFIDGPIGNSLINISKTVWTHPEVPKNL